VREGRTLVRDLFRHALVPARLEVGLRERRAPRIVGRVAHLDAGEGHTQLVRARGHRGGRTHEDRTRQVLVAQERRRAQRALLEPFRVHDPQATAAHATPRLVHESQRDLLCPDAILRAP